MIGGVCWVVGKMIAVVCHLALGMRLPDSVAVFVVSHLLRVVEAPWAHTVHASATDSAAAVCLVDVVARFPQAVRTVLSAYTGVEAALAEAPWALYLLQHT